MSKTKAPIQDSDYQEGNEISSDTFLFYKGPAVLHKLPE